MWNNVGDELVNDVVYNATAARLDSLGYRYELDAFRPCAHPATGCRVWCGVTLNVTTDGPIDIALPGCDRTVHADGSGSPLPRRR